jgi:hypothetical protein
MRWCCTAAGSVTGFVRENPTVPRINESCNIRTWLGKDGFKSMTLDTAVVARSTVAALALHGS